MGPVNGRGPGAMADINVTPMCDVMIVLLIIFMVATPFIGETKNLQLPSSRTADLAEKATDSVVLIRADGLLEMNGEVFALPGELAIRLQERLESRAGADGTVRIKADRGLRYGAVQEVLRACREAGARRVALVTSREAGSPPF